MFMNPVLFFMNDAISKKAALVGSTNIPNILRKMYFKTYSQSVQAYDNEEEGLDNLESNSEEDDNGGNESDDPLEFDYVNSLSYCYDQKLRPNTTANSCKRQ